MSRASQSPSFALELPVEGPPPPATPWTRRLGGGALQLTWRLFRPGDPGAFALGERPAEARFYYTANDGWRAPIYPFAPPAGAHGRPVVLAHGLGGGWRSLDLDPSHSLARVLAAAGYAVYILEHRGDPRALAPAGALPFSLDDVALRDLPAALDAVREHSGYERPLFLGVGLGGAALLLHLALAGDPGLAAGVLVGCPISWPSSSAVRAAGRLATLLPPGWRIPGRRLAQLLAPLCADGGALGVGDVSGPVARGVLLHGATDLHAGVLRQLGQWAVAGALTDQSGLIDVRSALERCAVPPMLVIAAEHDPRCTPEAGRELAASLRGEPLSLPARGALELLLGERASGHLPPAILEFLDRHAAGCAESGALAIER